MKKSKQILKQRMYSIVLYSLSPMQKGIQSYHATIEYSLKYGKTPEYQQWAKNDKTVIILDGGSSNQVGVDHYSGSSYTGSLDVALILLEENNIKFMPFFEPDCNNTMTAISFLVDEKTWDKKKYPLPKNLNELEQSSLEFWEKPEIIKLFGKEAAFLRPFLNNYHLAR